LDDALAANGFGQLVEAAVVEVLARLLARRVNAFDVERAQPAARRGGAPDSLGPSPALGISAAKPRPKACRLPPELMCLPSAARVWRVRNSRAASM
jgi:hypothetical protein